MTPLMMLLVAGAVLPVVVIVAVSISKEGGVPLEGNARGPTEHEIMVAEATDRND